MNSRLSSLKTKKWAHQNGLDAFLDCIEAALFLEKETGHAPVSYLDGVGSAVSQNGYFCETASYFIQDRFDISLPSFCSFMDFAVWLNLIGYVRAKAEAANQDVLEHAARFRNIPHSEDLIGSNNLVFEAVTSDRSELKKVLSSALKVRGKSSPRGMRERAKRWFPWRKPKAV